MRYKEFNRNRVLEICLSLFWQQGSGGVAISDIVEATNVNRFSLYEEFKNKEGILQAVIDLYRERYSAAKLELLEASGPTLEVLKDFYLSFLNPNYKHEGCFIIHIGTELADTDPVIKAKLKDYLKEIENLISGLLMRDPDLTAHHQTYAKHLTGLFCTSMSFCLIHSEKERLEHITNSIQVITNKSRKHATGTE
ncbi:MAG: TetR/AcrR family transcriptional regulator [Roseivirga sp.]|nr:TetR/AcrR family transcriptional regulator [Roseivirga sp.]